jgi:amino acid transporter
MNDAEGEVEGLTWPFMIQPAYAMNQQAPTSSPSLRRALGKWDLTAIGVNQVIGGAVFSLPAMMAVRSDPGAGSHSDWLRCCRPAIALNFAEAGSRFDGTGGPYLYTRAAFGRFSRSRWAG